MSKVRTRFAPSPTGYMHIGNLRTALYAYLLARSEGGEFILRIEDTDRERMVEGAIQVIYDTLKTAKLTYDEGPDKGGSFGPYIQSERTAIYKQYAEELVKSGHAYYCFCTKERLAELHQAGQGGGYDRHCRNLSPEEIESNLSAGMPYIIRQKAPLEGETEYTDQIFGRISVKNEDLQDLVLLKADGYPTYNFAHVVDDHLMQITHVVRGSEYVTSTPSYALLYDAFGWERPQYIHLPLIMGKGEDGSVSKLSKRHGSVSFQDLIAEGYLAEAIINYVVLLGWNPKTDEEVFSLSELENRFSASGINKSPALFDYEKLLWFNREYICKLSEEDFYAKVSGDLSSVLGTQFDLPRIAALIHPRLEKFSQVRDVVAFLAELPAYENDLFNNAKAKVTVENAPLVLSKSLETLHGLTEWNNENLFLSLKALAGELGIKPAGVMWIVRIAISGLFATPGGATDILELLGRDESLARIQAACKRFG